MATDTAPDKPARRLRARDLVEDRRIVLMLALGFSSGLPLLLVLGTFTLRLAFSDIDVKAIGLFSYVALPYSLKFLWAPLIDRIDVPVLSARLGRRRAWMVATQVAVAICLVLMAFADPKTSLALLGLGACIGSSWLLADDIAQGRLVRLLPRWRAAPLPVYMVYPYARFYPARLRRFVEAMREGVQTAVAGSTT